MSKILQVRLQQYVNWEIPDVQAGLEKAEEPEIKLPTSVGSLKNQREFQKNICFTDYTKAFDCVDNNKWWKFFKILDYQTIWPASLEICIQVKKQELEINIEWHTGSR